MKATGDEPLDVVNSGAEDWVGVTAADHEAAVRKQLALIVRALEDHAPPTADRPGCTYCQGALSSARIVSEGTDALVGLLQQAERGELEWRRAAVDYQDRALAVEARAERAEQEASRVEGLLAERDYYLEGRERAEQERDEIRLWYRNEDLAHKKTKAALQQAEQTVVEWQESSRVRYERAEAEHARAAVLEEALREAEGQLENADVELRHGSMASLTLISGCIRRARSALAAAAAPPEAVSE